MGKQKKATKKDLQTQINEIGGAVHNVYQEIHFIRQALIGTENVILYLSEFFEKREEFEEFLNEKIKQKKIADEKAKKEREQAIMEESEKKNIEK